MPTLSEIKRDAVEIKDLFEEMNHFAAIEPTWSVAYQTTNVETLRQLRRLGEDALHGIACREREQNNDRPK